MIFIIILQTHSFASPCYLPDEPFRTDDTLKLKVNKEWQLSEDKNIEKIIIIVYINKNAKLIQFQIKSKHYLNKEIENSNFSSIENNEILYSELKRFILNIKWIKNKKYKNKEHLKIFKFIVPIRLDL